MIKHCLVAICALTLVACASNKNSGLKSPEVDNTAILNSIEQSAKIIADAQRVTAESQNALRSITLTQAQKEAYKEVVGRVPPNMDKPFGIFEKNAELEKVAKLLALVSSYDFVVVNPENRPYDGVLVTAIGRGRSAYDVYRDIGTQAGKRAMLNLVVYDSSYKKTSKFGLLEVIYP